MIFDYHKHKQKPSYFSKIPLIIVFFTIFSIFAAIKSGDIVSSE